MEEDHIPNYKLDHGFLKDFVLHALENPSDETFNSKLPVFVQMIDVDSQIGDWNSYFVTDGKFKTSSSAFLSKQTMPKCYSILKIKKISKLPLEIRHYIQDFDEHSDVQDILGEIEFEVEVGGDQIGYSLCRDEEYIDIKEIREKLNTIRLAKLKENFKKTNPCERSMRFMWENRSEKLCSVKFTFPSEQGSVVMSHKSVLMSASEVFKTHFDSDRFIDSDSVAIVDTNSYYFNKLLEFVYLGKVQFTTVKVAFQLLYLSKKYLMPTLEKICQDVIMDYCDFDNVNLLKVHDENKKTEDDSVQSYVESQIRSGSNILDIINSTYLLNCDTSTIEWILSFNDLEVDEWSLLCALYKWACHNGVKASCDTVEDVSDPSDCLHRLLECIVFENIDMVSLERFFKLPKLSEIVDVSDFKQYVFDYLLEDGSYFNSMLLGTSSYSKYRDGFFDICAEIVIEDQEETRFKNIRLDNGPVLGLKIKVGQKDFAVGEHSLDIFLSFQYLYTTHKASQSEIFCIRAEAIQFKSNGSENMKEVLTRFTGELKVGESRDLKLHFPDCRSFLTHRIEDFEVNDGGNSKKKNVCVLEISCYKRFC